MDFKIKQLFTFQSIDDHGIINSNVTQEKLISNQYTPYIPRLSVITVPSR